MHEILVSKDTAVIKIKKLRNNLDKKLSETVRIQTELINYFFSSKRYAIQIPDFYKNLEVYQWRVKHKGDCILQHP